MEHDVRPGAANAQTSTIESLWFDLSGSAVEETLLEWPPDVFAFTGTVLERSEAFRFAVSPPAGRRWPPARRAGWSESISEAAAYWCAWAEERQGSLPSLVTRNWEVVRDSVETTLDDVGSGRAWAVCEALLTLHAISDEACAGMGVTLDLGDKGGYRSRARARELLVRAGSLARLPGHRMRVLPKGRTANGGISFRSLSRYVCLRGSAVEVAWHRVPIRRTGTVHQHTNILLLPWPLRVRQRDFRPVPGSVQRIEQEPFGVFQFEPSEPFDFDLLDRVLTAARDEVDTVDAVVLPESAVRSGELPHIEALLSEHRVAILAAGVRDDAAPADEPPANWVHLGVFLGDGWWHYRQNKHHRWFLDEVQIGQYHLAGALHPSVRWWEAMTVPRREVQFIELGEGITFVAVICEDLARLDEVADLLRAIGPTLAVTPLLDGPQLSSRWTARYAAVLADDPGSAVLTLTPYGMVERSRPAQLPPSSVVALWKDSTRGLREMSLDSGSHGLLLSVAVDRARRRTPDGRRPVDNVADLFAAGVRQIAAAETPAPVRHGRRAASPARLDAAELTILSSWVEAVAEAIAGSPADVDAVVADAVPGAKWRAVFGVDDPGTELAGALRALSDVVAAASTGPDGLTMEQTLQIVRGASGDGDPRALLAGRLLRMALESRLARRPT
ncbi:MAG: hypothetical protein ICV70_07355 [Jiangellaceae bacterium]|nr:hypothetical protein [Jiangellaceae bacterium]